jgi:hypothetical protein
MMRILTLSSLLCFAGVASAAIYKWVDENGMTHYSTSPPPGVSGTETVNVDPRPSGLRSTPPASMRTSPETSESGGRKDQSKGLDCVRAASNAQAWLNSMRDVGRINYRDGHMSQSEYDRGMAEIDQLKREITAGDCEGATGAKRDFYLCVNDIKNHVASCGQRYMIGR